MINKIGINFKVNEKRESKYEIFLADCNASNFTKLVKDEYSQNDDYDNITIKGSKKYKIKRREETIEYNTIVVKGTKNGASNIIAIYYYLDNIPTLEQKKTYGIKVTDKLYNLEKIIKDELEDLMDIMTFSREELIFTLGLIDNTEDEIYISYAELKNDCKSSTDYFLSRYVPFRYDNEIKIGFNLKTSIPSLIRMNNDASWSKCEVSRIKRVKDDMLDIFKKNCVVEQLATYYYASLPKDKIGIFEVENRDNLLDEDIIEDFIMYLHFCIS